MGVTSFDGRRTQSAQRAMRISQAQQYTAGWHNADADDDDDDAYGP